jgi:cytochrome c biogenesis protein ResB
MKLEELPASPRSDVESKKMADGELREGSGAWLQALGAFFVYTATWYVDLCELVG